MLISVFTLQSYKIQHEVPYFDLKFRTILAVYSIAAADWTVSTDLTAINDPIADYACALSY